MPIGVGRRFDFILGNKGFMLARGEFKGRAWQRTGRSDAPGQRSAEAAQYGVLPDELDHPEVWDDWSGGFGNAYHKRSEPDVFHWSEGFDSRWPKQLVHCQALVTLAIDAQASENAVNAFVDILPTATADHSRPGAGNLLMLGDHVLAIARPYGNLTTNTSTIATAADVRWGFRAATFGSYYYLPNLDGSSFERWDFTGAKTGTAGMPGHGFVVAGNRLWRFHGPGKKRLYLQSVAAGADPLTAANWSATLNVGNGQWDISDMVALEDQLHIGMPDGLYVGDQSGSFFNVLSQMSYQRHADNARTLAVHNNGVLVPHQGGVYYYQQQDYMALVREVGPTFNSSRSPIRGKISAMFSRGQWVYAGLWTGSTAYLLAGRDVGQGQPFIWYPLNRLSDVAGVGGPRRISRIHIDGISVSSGGLNTVGNRMYLGMDQRAGSSLMPVHYFAIPTGDGNPLSVDPEFGTPAFIASARIDLGAVDWDAPSTPKTFRSVEVWADNLLSGYRYADVYYDVDQSGSFTLLGRANDSPKSVLYFPSGEGSFVSGQSIEPSLRSTSIASAIYPTVTPVYRAIVLRGSLDPRSIDTISAVVRIADGLRDRQQGQMRAGATMLQELRDFSNPDVDGGPHQLIDLAGATQWAKVIGAIQEQEVYQQGEEYPEIAATVKMAVLSYS